MKVPSNYSKWLYLCSGKSNGTPALIKCHMSIIHMPYNHPSSTT